MNNVAAARRDQIRRDQILLLGDFHDDGLGHFHGHGHNIQFHDQKNSGGFRNALGTVDIHPDTALAGVSAFGAAALLAMYVAATQNTNGKRRKRRQLDDYSLLSIFDYVEPLLVAGKVTISMKIALRF